MTDYSGAPLWSRFLNSDRNASQGNRTSNPAGDAWKLPGGMERQCPPPGAKPGCPLPWDWEARDYIALDVETTGLDPYKDRVVEVGVVLFGFDRDGALQLRGEWSSLVNPGVPIPDAASSIHGITDLEVSAAPRFSDLSEEISVRVKGKVLVAHNAPFDASFITREYGRLPAISPVGEVADSLLLLRMAYPTLLSYNLGKAAYVLGIPSGQGHRALDDAKTCMSIFALCARRLAGLCP